MKAFTGIFMVLFMTAVSMGLLGAFLQVSRARTFHAMVIDELENSDYHKDVLEECLRAADNICYDMTVTLYEKEGGYVICKSPSDIPAEIKSIDLARVDMGFSIVIPFLGVENVQNIYGYGR
jgi:hypothetical protein